MKREYLELKTCRTEKAEFKRDKEYIVLDTTTKYTYEYDFKVLPCYRVINERGGIEIVVPDQIFYPTSRLLQSIKDVVYSGILDIDSLVEGEVYSVFKMNEEKGELVYTIFDDSNKLITYSTSLFVSEEQYIKMTKEELFDFKKAKRVELLHFENLRKKEEQRLLDEELEIKIDKEYLNLMVSFTDEILLKLKKIELNLLILENGTTVTSGNVSLIRESISFCLESYKTKDTNLLKDINIFLDKTLEYVYSLIEGDNSAELYIEKQIYENVSSIIKRNTDVFDLMISDNKEIREILNKDFFQL